MDILVEQLWQYIQEYGMEVSLLAVASIFMLGVIKVIFKKPFGKMDATGKKAIYETLSMAITYGIVALWIYTRVTWFGLSTIAFTWDLSLKTAGAVYLLVKVMYPLYENYGLRTLLRVIGSWVLSWFKKKVEITATHKPTSV